MVYIDIHSHLDYNSFDEDREKLVSEMKNNNILTLTNTTSPQNYEYTKSLFQNSKPVLVCPGLYPQEAEKITDKDFENYCKLLEKEQDKFIAIGEIGLDKHHTEDKNLFEIQIKRFKQLIELAIKLDKSIIVHTRKDEVEI